MAPEVLLCYCEEAKGYALPADVWSAGCVIHSLCSGKYDNRGPFYDDDSPTGGSLEKIFSAILEQRLSSDRIASPQALNLLQQMLVLTPDSRVTAAKALEHEWLAPVEPARSRASVALPSIARSPAQVPSRSMRRDSPSISPRRSPTQLLTPPPLPNFVRRAAGERNTLLRPQARKEGRGFEAAITPLPRGLRVFNRATGAWSLVHR